MKSDINKSNAKVYAFPIILMIILWVILFLPAGTIKFWQAWILWSGFSLITLFIAVYFTKKILSSWPGDQKLKKKKQQKLRHFSNYIL